MASGTIVLDSRQRAVLVRRGQTLSTATIVYNALEGIVAVIAGSPHLLQLRWLQVLGESSGNTVVLGVPSGPIPVASTSIESPPDGGELE